MLLNNMERQATWGEARKGVSEQGKARQARIGEAVFWSGKVALGLALQGTVWQASCGKVRQGPVEHGEVRNGRLGVLRFVSAWYCGTWNGMDFCK